MNKIMKPRHSGDSMELETTCGIGSLSPEMGRNERGTAGGLRVLEKKAFESP